jgi:hypothetical protein
MGLIILPLFLIMIVSGIFALVSLKRAARSSELRAGALQSKVAMFVAIGWAVLFMGPFIVNVGRKVAQLEMLGFQLLSSIVLGVLGTVVRCIGEEKPSAARLSFFFACFLVIGLLPVSWIVLGDLFRHLFHITWTH